MLEPELNTPSLETILDLKEDEILTGWVIAYEVAELGGNRSVGYLCSPGDTEWKSIGLLRWIEKMITNRPMDVDE